MTGREDTLEIMKRSKGAQVNGVDKSFEAGVLQRRGFRREEKKSRKKT